MLIVIVLFGSCDTVLLSDSLYKIVDDFVVRTLVLKLWMCLLFLTLLLHVDVRMFPVLAVKECYCIIGE